ncbi:MAG: PAS-domain containing protein [Pseudomonadota bacterium]
MDQAAPTSDISNGATAAAFPELASVGPDTAANAAWHDDALLLTLDALSEAIVVQDGMRRVIARNTAAARLLGDWEGGLLGSGNGTVAVRAIREDGSSFPHEDFPTALAWRTAAPQRNVVMGLSRETGPITWISVSAVPIGADGAPAARRVITSCADITAHKIAQETLHEAVGAIPDGFAVYDWDDRLIMCNDAYRRIYAESAEAIRPGASFAEIVRYGVHRGQYPEAGETFEQREAWVEERVNLRRTMPRDILQQLPRDRWLQIRERRTPSGYTVGFRIDVSDLKRESTRLQAAIDNFPGDVSFFERNGTLVACNDGFRTLLGLPDRLFGAGPPSLDDIADVIDAELDRAERNELLKQDLDLVRSGEAHLSTRIWPDGRVIEAHGAPVHGGGYVLNYIDVTERHAAHQRLRDSEQRARTQSEMLQITLAHMSQGLSMFDGDGQLMVWNDRYLGIYGMSPTVVKQGAHIRQILEHRREAGDLDIDVEPYLQNLRNRLQDNSVVPSITHIRHGRMIAIVNTPIPGGGWVATHEDITDIRRSELLLREKAEELSRTNMRLDAALSNMSQGLCLFDADKRLTISNRRFREIYGLTEQQAEPGIHVADILRQHERNGETSHRAIDELVEAMPKTPCETFRLRDGRVISIRRMATPDGGWVATHEDITEQERASERISHLAYHDVLTGLANRAEFTRQGESALQDAVRQNSPISLLLVDLDRFKAVNDTFGHSAGDKLLQLVAERMRQNVRSCDIVARLGGDEFAIIQAPEPDQREAAIALAARLVDTLSEPYQIGDHQAMIGASVGVAVATDRRDSIEQLMHRADLALYRVKGHGRNGYRIYEDGLDRRADDRLRLGQELRAAIANGELVLHYQPIVALKDESVCGMEALVRWKHPARGMMSPDQFIPIAEETGLIVPLGEFVIRQACLDASRWPEHVRVAVNISPTHIKRRTLMDTVTRALLKARLAPERLEIEVTETVLLQQDEDILTELHQLRSLGISVALDDFGTGYSSLSHLRMFSFDKIKIDRSFVAELTERPDSAAIVCAVTGLARSLDMKTTAEGIENEQQLRMLQAAGCVQGQGYLFGRPKPVTDSISDIFAAAPLRQTA